MRLILIILIFFSGTVLSRYYEKRRFDRSVYDNVKALPANEQLKKEWTFTDYETHFKAYKDREENNCYIEILGHDVIKKESTWAEIQRKQTSKVLYATNEPLTKFEAWKTAGGRVVNFCAGRKIILLQYTVPTADQVIDPFFNILPFDENDIVTRRVADVVLTPLISRAKREVALEERQRHNENFKRNRSRRQVHQPAGKFHGQTQSQYLSIGNSDPNKDGKAEAEATRESSHAVVSGSYGMGQAQSMSLGNIGCEDCPKYTNESPPERYIHHPRPEDTGGDYGRISAIRPGHGISGAGKTNVYPSTFPSFNQQGGTGPNSGMVAPGIDSRYPNKIAQGKDSGDVSHQGKLPDTTTGGQMVYHGNIPGEKTGGTQLNYPGNIPGSDATYPQGASGVTGPTTGGNVPYSGGIPISTAEGNAPYLVGAPGSATGRGTVYLGGVPGFPTGGNIPYPGGMPGSTTGGNTPYPVGIPGSTTGGNVPYPGGIPGSTTGGNIPYPGGIPGSTTGGNVPYPGGIPGSATGRNIPYPGGIPGSTTGGNIPYPGGIPGSTTEGNVPYPGGIPGSTIGGNIPYPGGIPGSTTGGSIPYLESRPRSSPGTSIVYPGGVPVSPTAENVLYPGKVPGFATKENVPYPQTIPGSPTGPMPGSGIYPQGLPGSVSGGYVPHPNVALDAKVESGTAYTGQPATTGINGGTYPGGVPGTAIESSITYPGNVPTRGGPDYSRVHGAIPGVNAPYPVILPGTTSGGSPIYPQSEGFITGGSIPSDNSQGSLTNRFRTYPSDIGPSSTGMNTGQILTESKAAANSKIYPNGQVPKVQYFGGEQYPTNRDSNLRGDTYQNVGPVGAPQGEMSRGTTGVDARGGYPNGYPRGVGQNVAVNRGTVPDTPGLTSTGNRINYPASSLPGITRINTSPNIMRTGTTSTADTTATYPTGTIIYGGPDNSHRQKLGGGQSGILYPEDHVKYPGRGTVESPESGQYSINRGTMHPGYSPQEGQYPDTAIWQGRETPGLGRESEPGGTNRQQDGQYPNERQGIRQQYSGFQYPSNIAPTTNIGDISQYYQQPGTSVPADDDTSSSQASSSIKHTDSGTQASASAQGKYGEGTAQSQVTGTYSGSGSFSAQAGSTDPNKSVQTEIGGGKEGATSNAQGVGGYGKSQVQVQLNSESGSTTTGAQSSGWNHGTNSQVQASSRGGMADAQANGEGSTSSQAQIGFQPYLNVDEKVEKRTIPFRGGGSASAQSGAHTGQSQSQLEGSFQYGITYTGAAQAGSGSGAGASRKPFNFSLADTEPFKPSYIPQTVQRNGSVTTNSSSNTDYTDNPDKLHQGLQTSSSSLRRIISKPLDHSQNAATKLNQSVDKLQVDDTIYDYEEDYDSEDYDTPPNQSSVNSKISKTYITEQNDSHSHAQGIHMIQDTTTAQVGGISQPGDSLSGYNMPPSLRGRATSGTGEKFIAQADGKSQSQVVTSVSKEPSTVHGNKSPISETRSLKTNHERLIKEHTSSKAKQKINFLQNRNQQVSPEYSRSISNTSMKPSYYTITNSVAGKMDDRNSPRKYEHRYYTKSSTCGYFTFSCNIVYGSNGRTKICKPKLPTYSDGTPMKC